MDIKELNQTNLFKGTTSDEAEQMLNCLSAYQKEYRKGESVMRAGSIIEDMGMVLSGGVNIEIDDAWGNKTILSHVNPGQLFAETYACIPGEPLLVNVTASEKSTILFLNASKVMHCPASDPVSCQFPAEVYCVIYPYNFLFSKEGCRKVAVA